MQIQLVKEACFNDELYLSNDYLHKGTNTKLNPIEQYEKYEMITNLDPK